MLSILPSVILPKPLRRLKARAPVGIPKEKITSFPWLVSRYQIRLMQCKSLEARFQTYAWAASELNRLIINQGYLNQANLYTFNRAGLELMQHMKGQSGVCVMEQTSAPMRVYQRMIDEELSLYPNWESELSARSNPSCLADREEEEWKYADMIVCSSDHVRKAIGKCNGPMDKCRVVPHGIDQRFNRVVRTRHTGPLRVLTVGMVNLGKGTPYIWETAKRLSGKAEFRIVGLLSITAEARNLLAEHVQLTGQVPRSEIASHYAWADVFFLPSLSEGSALVVYEALSAGLPVVCTPNTGSVVRHGYNGYIVPIRDIEAMCIALSELADDRTKLDTLAANALASKEDYSFESYRGRLLRCLNELSTLTL